MKLYSKFALYNAISKVIIVVVFVIVMPFVVSRVAIFNTDRQLEKKRDQVLQILEDAGISSFLEEGSSEGYGSYNILKEEFISLEETDSATHLNHIENSARQVEQEIVDYRVLMYSFSSEGKYYLLEVARSLSTIQDIESSFRRFALITLVIISLVAIAIDVSFAKHLLGPLRAIVGKLRAIRDPASFPFQPVPTTTEDFKYLDDSINQMMTRIEQAFSKERQFISNVSHELLTPVSIIQSKLENLLGRENVDENTSVRLAEALKTTTRLKNIIRALLLISRIENDQYLLNDSVSIASLVDDVTTEIEERLEAKEITLDKGSIQDYTLRGNASLLHTMLFNLINNAVKYNHAGGSIVIRGFMASDGYTLEIEDTGIGIPAENIQSIFDRFKRLRKSDDEGFGLGLPIAQTIANLHQIRIQVVSSPGKGSIFSLSFSKVAAPPKVWEAERNRELQ